MNNRLWNKNFVLLTAATVLGAAGGIASSFALSFLVFDETGSTFASALLIAIQLIPQFLIPFAVSPWMDRFPRKPFLVAGDAINGILYALAGVYLLSGPFSYTGYLFFSLLLSVLGAFDMLAYNALYPNLIPAGCEQKGYTVCGMIYPTMTVIMTPAAALLYEKAGIAVILLLQGVFSILAAITESCIQIDEKLRMQEESFSMKLWIHDLKDAFAYLKREKGIGAVFSYMAVTNGVGTGYSPILIAFFRSTPGFGIALYSLFSIAEFAGRTAGGLLHYHITIPQKRRFSFAFLAYQIYEAMDMLLLWLPYPLMLANRAVCGCLGINSATMREAAVQTYIPDELRAKLNAFQSILVSAGCCIATLIVGALGEWMDYRLCITVCGAFSCAVCWMTIWRKRKDVRMVYENIEE